MSAPQRSVYTAVTLQDDDVQSMITQPLLQDEELARPSSIPRVVVHNKDCKKTLEEEDIDTSCHHGRFVVLGVVTGFLIQVVSLGAYALLLLHYNKHGNGKTADTQTVDPMAWWPSIHAKDSTSASPLEVDWKNLISVDWFIYGLLSVLTQIDLVIYVLIWIAFTCTMTRNGMDFLRFQYRNPQLRRRWVFVLGVYFLVGIVLGAFCAWSMIDMYLGFPIPFLPIVATVGIDLVLCYLMVWCYDLGRSRSSTSEVEDYDDDEEEEGCGCC